MTLDNTLCSFTDIGPKDIGKEDTHTCTQADRTACSHTLFDSLENQLRKSPEANLVFLILPLAHYLLHLHMQTVFFVALPT